MSKFQELYESLIAEAKTSPKFQHTEKSLAAAYAALEKYMSTNKIDPDDLEAQARFLHSFGVGLDHSALIKTLKDEHVAHHMKNDVFAKQSKSHHAEGFRAGHAHGSSITEEDVTSTMRIHASTPSSSSHLIPNRSSAESKSIAHHAKVGLQHALEAHPEHKHNPMAHAAYLYAHSQGRNPVTRHKYMTKNALATHHARTAPHLTPFHKMGLEHGTAYANSQEKR